MNALFPYPTEGWAEKFGAHRPARATVRADLLLDGLVVEIQAIAAVPG
jgi:enamine deaminase RidA (YjgF/YER057c/UK114 family)